jgi:hypothetical protein
MKKALLSIVFLLVSHLIIGQIPTMQWQKSLGGTGDERANSMAKTADGGFIVAGETNSTNGDVIGNNGGKKGWVIKFNNFGTIEWQKLVNNEIHAIIQTSDGGYALACNNSSSYLGYLIIKLNNIGTIEWQKTVQTNTIMTFHYLTISITQTIEGEYVVAGFSNNRGLGDVNSKDDFFVFKLSNDGSTLLWQKTYGGSDHDRAYAMAKASDGGYFITGRSFSNDGDVSGNAGDFGWVLKISSNGNIQWQRKLNGDFGQAISSTSDGGCIAATTGADIKVFKLNNSGVVEWQKNLGGTEGEFSGSIIQTPDGGYIVAGSTASNDGDVTGNHGGSDAWIVKLESNSTIEWQKTFGGSSNDFAHSVIQPSDGGYIFAGFTQSNNGDVSGNHGGSDFWVVKFLVRDFTVSPNYPCQDKYVKLTSEGCAGTTRWYAYPEGQTPTLIHTGINYNYLVPNTIPLSTAIFFKAECTTTSGFVISMGAPKFVRVLGASSYNFVSPTNDFTSTPPYPLNVANSITAANKILAPTPPITTRVEYRAEKGILLKPGFRADKGTVFTAYIGGCQ